MKTILALILSVGFCALAAPAGGVYQLKLELAVGGKHIASPTLKVNSNEKAVVTQKGEDGETYILEVTATPQDQKAVKFDFVVAKAVDGKRTVLSTPQIITRERKAATITVNNNDGSEELSLKVWAKKVKK